MFVEIVNSDDKNYGKVYELSDDPSHKNERINWGTFRAIKTYDKMWGASAPAVSYSSVNVSIYDPYYYKDITVTKRGKRF